MKVTSSVLASTTLGVFTALAAPVQFPSGLKNLTTSDSYHMDTVRVVQARVQSDKPEWNVENGLFVSKYYSAFDEAFRGVMDTVNTASVEGALMYVQAEGINYASRGTTKDEWCTRKNNMNFVVFYEMVITQTNETLALYDGEYGKYLAMDGGQCTPSSGVGDSAVFPTECDYFNGNDGQPNVGPSVGGEERQTDVRAPYPNTWWFSFPNTCPLQVWANKTDECRATTRGGLCDYDIKPDGVKCTFNYRILGWVPIDDLVGITAMTAPTTGTTYTNFTEFCQAGNVEFNATTDGVWIDSIAFWENPQNDSANTARATKLVDLYNNALSGNATLTQVNASDLGNFKVLPTIAKLREENPPCYKNVAACATATFGCKRDLYGQICSICEAAADECIVAPIGFTFPTLVMATAAPSTSSSTSDASSSSRSSTSSPSSTSSSPPATSATAPAFTTRAGFASVAAFILACYIFA